ncbi:MAG: hypothetical protein QXW70_02300 [Candidatus Anstonellales archaeon]
MIREIFISFLTGLFVKKTDELADKRRKKEIGLLAYLLPFLYSLGLSYLIFFTGASSLFLAGIIGVLLAGKVDHRLHLVGILPPLFLLPIFQLPQFSLLHFSIFLFASFLDEKIAKFKEYTQQLLNYRPFLPLSAFLLSIYSTNFLYFLSVLSFDVGYNFAFLKIQPTFSNKESCRKSKKR